MTKYFKNSQYDLSVNLMVLILGSGSVCAMCAVKSNFAAHFIFEFIWIFFYVQNNFLL